MNRKFLRFNICILKEPNKAEGKSRNSHTGRRSNNGDSSSMVANQREALKKGVVSKFSTCYMINVQLVKGTPLVFLDFTHNFFSMIEKRLQMQRMKY